jgi:Family of unknown function (DUF6064)
MLPFSPEQFFEVFRQYNEAVWPFQIVLKVLAAAVAVLLLRPQRWSNEAIAAALAFLWGWMGVVYHLLHFSSIDPAANWFAALFLVQALVFVWEGVVRRRMRFEPAHGARFVAGAALIVYPLLVYPQLSGLLGHYYPAAPTFGLPCPTTIFTVGVLVFLAPPYPRRVLVVPILWCILGTAAVFLLEMPEDLGLAAAAIVGAALLLRKQAASWWRRGV